MSTNTTVVIDPKEYGLELSQASLIESAFAPKVVERLALTAIYERLITSEITPELCAEAKLFGRQLAKNRNGVADIHKTQKAMSLAYGRFCDAKKNAETLPVEQMEDVVEQLANHYVNIEKKRLADLKIARASIVAALSDFVPDNIEVMDEQVFASYVKGLEVAKFAREEEALKAIESQKEADRIKELHETRKSKCVRLIDYMPNYEALNFGILSDIEFGEMVGAAVQLRTKFEDEQERIKAENEKLKADAETERKKQADILAAQQAEAKRIQDAKDAENAKLQAELKAKQDAENARLAAEKMELENQLAAAKLAAAAPVNEQMQTIISGLTLSFGEISNEKTIEISAKFEAFKKWALTVIQA